MINFYDFTVLITALLMLYSSISYVQHSFKNPEKPVLATWILMFVVFGGSFWIYCKTPEKSLSANIALFSGFINVIIILVGVIISNLKYYKSLRFAFNKVQVGCLIAGFTILIFWSITSNPLISYILLQTIALIAYLATIIKLLKLRKSSEPLLLWVAVFMATILAAYPAIIKNDIYSYIYLIRAIPSSLFMTILIWKKR